jgi:hypothetical protein
MTLKKDEASWLYRFSGGLVPLVPEQPEPGATEQEIEAVMLGNARAEAVARFRVIRAKETADELALKRSMIDNAAQALQGEKEAMRKAFKMTTIDNGKKVHSQDKHGDQTKEIDTRDVKHDTKVEGDLKGASEMMKLIAEERLKLSNARVNRSRFDDETAEITVVKEDLFEVSEITREFYTPLVRDLVIPENLVPKRFSKTQQMVSGSNDYYIKECQEKGKDPDSGYFALAKGAVSVASQACTAGFGANTDHAAIVQGVAALLTVGIDGAQKAVNKELTASDWSTIVGGLAGPIGDVIGGSTENTYFGAQIGDSIAAGVAGVDIVVRVAAWKKRGGPFPTAEIIGAITVGVSKSLSAKSDASSGADAVNFGDASALANEVGMVAKASYIAAMKADAAGLGDAFADGDWKKVRRLMRGYALEAGLAAAAEAGKAAVAVHVVDRLDQAQTSATNEAQKTLGDDIASGASADKIKADKDAVGTAAPTSEELLKIINLGNKQADAIGEMAEKLQAVPEKREEFRKKAEELRKKYDKADDKTEELEELKTVEAELAKEREEYQKSLNRLSTNEPSDEDFKSIAKLIAKIETDRAIMKAAAAVGSAGFTVAQEFFAPLKAAGSLIKFLVNLQAAVERAIALSKWVDARKGAVSAVSPYSTSIENFVKNQAEQFSHYTIQSALMAIQTGSAIAENGYPPVKALTIAAGAAATLEDTIYKFYKQQSLVKAWKTTKLSLEDPQNRKLALVARRMNPSLAKYTIAYGALIDQDPIAVRAMNSIGLDREALSRANDQVGLVKKFLQTTYPDDGEVFGKLPATAKGRKVPTPALRVKPWLVSHMMWTQDMALVGESPTAIALLLSKVEFYADHFTDTRAPKEEAAYFEGREAALQGLVVEFRSYDPRNKFGQSMPEVQAVLDAYADLAAAEQESVALIAESKLAQTQ